MSSTWSEKWGQRMVSFDRQPIGFNVLSNEPTALSSVVWPQYETNNSFHSHDIGYLQTAISEVPNNCSTDLSNVDSVGNSSRGFFFHFAGSMHATEFFACSQSRLRSILRIPKVYYETDWFLLQV